MGIRAITCPRESESVTSRSSIGVNHPTEALPISSVPLRSDVTCRATRFLKRGLGQNGWCDCHNEQEEKKQTRQNL